MSLSPSSPSCFDSIYFAYNKILNIDPFINRGAE